MFFNIKFMKIIIHKRKDYLPQGICMNDNSIEFCVTLEDLMEWFTQEGKAPRDLSSLIKTAS